MFLELIATFVAGLAAAGVMMIVNRLTGRRLPRWLVPVAAGLAMLAATLTSEYGWFERTRATLPGGFEVVETAEARAAFRPWTYLFPYVERFVAVDTASFQTHPERADERIAAVYFFGRWSGTESASMVADCAARRRALLVGGVSFDAAGAVRDVQWVTPGPGDNLLGAVCGDAQ